MPLYSLNRRSYDRYVVDDSATLLLDNNREQPLILHDVSSRGVGVIGDYPFRNEATVKVVLRSSLFEKPMFKTANVAWCRKIDEHLYHAGLDFGLDKKIELSSV